MMYFQEMFHSNYLIFLAAQDHLDDMMSLLSESTMTLPANTKRPVCQKTENKAHNGSIVLIMAQMPSHCVPQLFAIPMYRKPVSAHMDGNIEITVIRFIFIYSD